MPRVVIKEYDLTTAATANSDTFAVVVPGFVKSGSHDLTYNGETVSLEYGLNEKGESVFDENGVYACDDQTDFENYVGKVTAKTEEAIAPVISATYTGGDIKEEPGIFYETYKGQIYERAVDNTVSSVGYLCGVEENSGEDGETTTTYYKYSKVEDWSNIAEDGEYYVILTGKEGQDANAAIAQYGNQIAHVLLGLGYTVLYKKISQIDDLIDSAFWSPLKDKSIYDFRYIVSGLIDDIPEDGAGGETTQTVSIETVNKLLIEVAANDNSVADTDASGRGDCIALLDIPESAYTESGLSMAKIIANIQKAASITSQYAAYFAPSVSYEGIEDDDYGDNVKLPGSTHYLVCAAQAFSSYKEWYAVAGYNRGVGQLDVAGTTIKLGDAAVNALQPRGRYGEEPAADVNIIVNLSIGNRANSYYLWGNRTAYCDTDKEDLVASNFLNIRQLCCTLKKEIYTTCRQLMFDPNSDILWLNFCNAIRSTLDDMKANQGIKDYRFEKKTTSKKGKLFAAIRIVPIEAVEDFEIGVTLEDSLDETTITLTELN